MFGAGVRSGAAIEGAALPDIAPTVLALMGLPLPRDMEGRVLAEAFEPGYVETAKTVDTYEVTPFSPGGEEAGKEKERQEGQRGSDGGELHRGGSSGSGASGHGSSEAVVPPGRAGRNDKKKGRPVVRSAPVEPARVAVRAIRGRL